MAETTDNDPSSRLSASSRTVTVTVGANSAAMLGADEGDARLAARLIEALGYYLADRGRGHGGWAYPEFRRERGSAAEIELRIEVDPALWSEFSAEAAAQGVAAERLLEHAALYLAADRDSGRLARRLAEEVDASEGD